MGWKLTVVAVVLTATAAARADELRAPQNVNAEPWSRQSSELATRAAKAEMQGMSQQAISLADQAIQATPQDPWPHYIKGMSLARLGQTDAAVASLGKAEQRFSPADRWGRSVAIYGRANTYALAGRCAEARQAFEQYAVFVEAQAPQSAAEARSYASDCRAPSTATPPGAPETPAPATPPSGNAPASTPPSP